MAPLPIIFEYFDKPKANEPQETSEWAALTKQFTAFAIGITTITCLLGVIAAIVTYIDITTLILTFVGLFVSVSCWCACLGYGYNAADNRNLVKVRQYTYCMLCCGCYALFGLFILVLVFAGAIANGQVTPGAGASSTNDGDDPEPVHPLQIVDFIIDIVGLVVVVAIAYSSYNLMQNLRYGPKNNTPAATSSPNVDVEKGNGKAAARAPTSSRTTGTSVSESSSSDMTSSASSSE